MATSSTTRDLSWCFKPIFFWMRILGVELDPAHQKTINVYGVLLLLFSAWVNVDATLYEFWFAAPKSSTANSMDSTTTFYWNVKIDFVNNCLLVIGVYFTLLVVAQNQWKLLWKAVIDFEFYSKLQSNHIDRLRRQVFICFVPVCTVKSQIHLFSNFKWPKTLSIPGNNHLYLRHVHFFKKGSLYI